MIPNQWYVILESKEVEHGKPIGFTRFGGKPVARRDAPVVLYRRRELIEQAVVTARI